jgi:hypothetical protein
MVKIQKRAIFALGAISVTVALIAMIAYPAYAANEQSYNYALNQENWAAPEEYTSNSDTAFANVRTITIDAEGYAFIRVDEDTLKQYNVTTSLIIQIQPATENTERKVAITGYVKVNGVTYTIESGKVVLRTDKKLVFINCQGLDESENEISLKLGARYFWWGGKAYALRTRALLQTADKPVLLLQRGIAKIQ